MLILSQIFLRFAHYVPQEKEEKNPENLFDQLNHFHMLNLDEIHLIKVELAIILQHLFEWQFYGQLDVNVGKLGSKNLIRDLLNKIN